jgi:Icc-related predicted phosphoesterase
MTLTVCATADLHGWLPPVSPCDLLLIAGDICPPTTHQREWLDTNFRTWLAAIPARHVVATWGNNDVVGERGDAPELPCTFLVDEMVTVSGLTIYGTRWSTGISYQAWASREEDDLLDGISGRLPAELDILLSHIPPFGVLDADKRGQHPWIEDIARRDRADASGGHDLRARSRRTGPLHVFLGRACVQRRGRRRIPAAT